MRVTGTHLKSPHFRAGNMRRLRDCPPFRYQTAADEKWRISNGTRQLYCPYCKSIARRARCWRTPIDGHFLDFRDHWGNRIENVGYDNIEFTKAPNVLRGMELTHLTKNESAKKELAKKGMALERD